MEIYTEIEINASCQRVWQLLTDFSSYPEWNPLIREAKGDIEKGRKIEVYIQPPGGGGMRFRPVILEAEENRQLRWLGHLGIPGLFDGEHIFTITPLSANRIKFVHREIFNGLLVFVFKNSLQTSTKEGFIAMNQSLKVRAETS
jgi:hypothetical protein